MSEREPPRDQERLPTAAEVIVSTAHLLITVGFERTGLGHDPAARDLPQTEQSIEALRALMPVLERLLPADALLQYRQALSDLQMAYAESLAAKPAAPADETTPADEPAVESPPRPKIWTPRGDV